MKNVQAIVNQITLPLPLGRLDYSLPKLQALSSSFSFPFGDMFLGVHQK